ncbi:hypothetical protein CK516_06515 [Nostoc sp. 'Peltigera malacea cyanobiont' DB3992]|nr:hypothetical protein CK516_06515 [Nostoc sp. 'Peltigera malacea cyanobiont' DB3992]
MSAFGDHAIVGWFRQKAEGKRKKKTTKSPVVQGLQNLYITRKVFRLDLGLYHKFYDDRQNLKTLLPTEPPAFCLKARNLSSSPKVDKNRYFTLNPDE